MLESSSFRGPLRASWAVKLHPVDVREELGAEEPHRGVMSDDSLQEVVMLARRLRESAGEDLDDAAIMAIAEATGAPTDDVRLAVQVLPEEEKRAPISRIKASFLAFDQNTRRYTMSGVLATATALAVALGSAFHDSSGFTGTLALVLGLAAAWNCVIAKDRGSAAFAGAIFGGLGFLMTTLFMLLVSMFPLISQRGPEPQLLIPITLAGALGGLIAHRVGVKYRKKLGLKDPASERHDLLHQLLAIQDQLKSDERIATFLSVDIVGSTKIKAHNDPLSVEFTFNEYHKFVEAVALKNGGRVHSTAGDGVIVVFDDPKRGYAAGRALMAGLFEFNSYMNRLDGPIVLRGGLHTGNVLAPGQDIRSVNFAHVIDIAAHLQKASPAGCLAVSDQTSAYIPGGKDSIGGETVEAHDVAGVVWRPRNTVLPTPIRS